MFNALRCRFAVTVFLIVSISILRTTAFQIEIEPWETDRPAPGDILFYNVVIEPGDPNTVDIILYNGELGNFTIIFDNDRFKGDSDATGFNIPSVPPGTQYTGRLGRPNTRGLEILAESRPFEIFPAGTKPSTASGSSSRSSTRTTSSQVSVSVATMTKILTLQPSSTPPTQTQPGGAMKLLSGMGTLVGTLSMVLFFTLM
ncbi:hypothetical protein BJ165DRAFT_656840 [Panaeolus papilionaceus]|nr:hypothetical protein BJ165DRAFT_656840 [Panaeolus papilionaceus]